MAKTVCVGISRRRVLVKELPLLELPCRQAPEEDREEKSGEEVMEEEGGRGGEKALGGAAGYMACGGGG